MREVYILLVLCIFITGVNGATCPASNTDPCKCETDEGTVDLSSLDSGSSSEPGMTTTSSTYTFDYNPCTPFTTGSGGGGPGCDNILACQSDGTGYFPLGDTSDVQWGSDSSGNLQLTMTNTDSQGTYRTTYVSLVCDQGTDKDFSAYDGGGGTNTYYFTVTSKCCCPGGCSGGTPGGGGGSTTISIGTIIVIAFVAVLLVYVVGGILFMHFSQGASGVEMIPNVTFWKAVPGLVKDGTMFIVYRVKGQSGSGYDQI